MTNDGTKPRLSTLGLMFWTVSFFGWAYEKLYFFFFVDGTSDRGFLTLPFCTIYGTTVLLAYFLLGTPRRPRLFPHRSVVLRVGGYFVAASLCAAAAELVFGALFDLLGAPLWSYAAHPANFGGYVALAPSLLWGALITLAMGTAFEPLARVYGAIPRFVSSFFLWTVTLCAAADAVWNFWYFFSFGAHFALF